MTASWWQRLRDGEQRQIDRGLSRIGLVTLFVVLLVVNDFEVGTETRTIAWFVPLLVGVNPNLSTFGIYRSRRRALAANLERARLG